MSKVTLATSGLLCLTLTRRGTTGLLSRLAAVVAMASAAWTTTSKKAFNIAAASGSGGCFESGVVPS